MFFKKYQWRVRFVLLMLLLLQSQILLGEDNFNSSENQQHFFIESTYQDTTFTEVPILMENLGHGTAAWGDYDNDGDLDVLITGIGGRDSSNLNDPSPHISKIYRNDNGTFVDINAQLVGVNNNDGTIWCDYDNDGDLDLFIGGATIEPNANPVSKIYRNDNGIFIDINASIPGLVGTAAWGDYDNDADLDLLIGGSPDNGYTFMTKLYRNDNGIFVEVQTVFPGVWGASFAWGDYDNDGDPDLLMIGYGTYGATSKLFRNDGPSQLSSTDWVFTDTRAQIVRVNSGSVAWGDYDNDGNLDILLSGYLIGGSGGYTTIYRNDGNGNFVNIHPGLVGVGSNPTASIEYQRFMKSNNKGAHSSVIGVGNCAAGWWDYDNDGDPDIIISGQTSTDELVTKIYRNDNGIFVDIGAQLTGVWYSALAWGDYDNDGDIDLIVTGFSKTENWWPYKPITKLYRNNSNINNIAPTIPDSLIITSIGNSVTLKWNKSNDNQTPQSKLTYNIRLGTISGGNQRVSAMSDVSTGYRMVPRPGNTNNKTSFSIKNLPPGTYYWSVQAVDNGYAGSAFAAEQSFTVTSSGDIKENLPKEFNLFQNYPNPFNPSTTIEFSLPEDAIVTLKIYNLLGQKVATLLDNEEYAAGEHSIKFYADKLSSGIYFYRIVSNNGKYQDFKKMLLLK